MHETQGLHWNPLLRQYQLVSPHRMQRREGTSECPFCADLAHGRVAEGALVWSRPNDFPPLTPPDGEAHIVLYSRDHQKSFAEASKEEAEAIVDLWSRLTTELAARYAAVMIFENSGQQIGQTQLHPHGQAYGLSVVPPVLARELETIVQACDAASCPFCALVSEWVGSAYEIASTEHWLVVLPPFARYPYEIHVYPRQHTSMLYELTVEQRSELAALLPRIIRVYHALADGAMKPMPYMLGIHQLSDQRYHQHVEILAVGRAPGKLKYAASAEALWGFWSNDSSPLEKAAEPRAFWEQTP